MRGLLNNYVIENTGTEVPALVDRILSKGCPVSAEITQDDRVRLLAIKKAVAEKAAGKREPP